MKTKSLARLHYLKYTITYDYAITGIEYLIYLKLYIRFETFISELKTSMKLAFFPLQFAAVFSFWNSDN